MCVRVNHKDNGAEQIVCTHKKNPPQAHTIHMTDLKELDEV